MHETSAHEAVNGTHQHWPAPYGCWEGDLLRIQELGVGLWASAQEQTLTKLRTAI